MHVEELQLNFNIIDACYIIDRAVLGISRRSCKRLKDNFGTVRRNHKSQSCNYIKDFTKMVS